MVGPEATLEAGGEIVRFVALRSVLGERLGRMPVVLRLLVENHIRATSGDGLDLLLAALDGWLAGDRLAYELSFRPGRLLMHDTTCTPALADIAGLKDALSEAGGDAAALYPTLPVEVSVDHSLSVDSYAVRDALARNASAEMARNSERYAFLKWASREMRNLRVNPPGTGIMHTINLEQLATVLEVRRSDGGVDAFPDALLGTDSHTPMINGIGVLGWGVGGLEAESVMFGQTVSLAMPEIVGVRLTGSLVRGVLSTDLALKVTHELRKLGVTGCFVEFFGPGVSTLSADDRAVVANMAPEYGATTGYFPVDARTVEYLQRTGRAAPLLDLIPAVFDAMGLWFDEKAHPRFDREIEIDLSTIQPSLAGPRRPQDLCTPGDSCQLVEGVLGRPLAPRGDDEGVPDGAVGVAAITSCTNTSDPRLLIAAGLLARNANRLGLRPKSWVKTSLAPGSPSAAEYLSRSGLLADLGAIGFDIVGFGCTTCIGNSGPLPAPVQQALSVGKAVVAVLSGNRNFPGRVHPMLDLAYLASPPLVVAYALRGDIKDDILTAPIAEREDGRPVYLRDLWPGEQEIDAIMAAAVVPEDVPAAFAKMSANAIWAGLDAPEGARFPWNPESRYLRRPKFASFSEVSRLGHYDAAPLLVLGDDITTDHISPAGRIDVNSEAGRWLVERGGDARDLNVYAAYRGNWEVMLRGLFTNRLAKNSLIQGGAAGETVVDGASGSLPLYLAADFYEKRNVSRVILAGERYGMGSSRDWAAKGAALLGARAVIARSFERIHRTNLIGMGVLPVRIMDDFIPAEAGLVCQDRICVRLDESELGVRTEFEVEILKQDGTRIAVSVCADVETRQEIDTLKAGGILPGILRAQMALN
ncbi:aconitate hydratase AcnA [Radicibacter daui]|uniref:aconitate hydratase AcnA n=1 Tax=Radicibacter daui TaxID=3064829 RepID=UPI004046A118